MSSRIQNPRPCVPAIRSASLIARSRIDVAGMLSRSDCHVLAIVERHEHGLLAAGEQQAAPLRILAHDVDDAAVGQAAHDLRPGLAAVARAEDVRPQIVEPQRVDGGVRGVRDRSARLR